ncbi:MAG TPA: hypothetical protein VG325_04300 [Solirubrobacteraceae bacterium]|nr:hypothetical protein [Solirubrobacteraceae bacterium]
MRAGFPPRRARDGVIAGAVMLVVCGCWASSAGAATGTIAVTNNTAAPEQAVPVDLTISGTYPGSTTAYVEAVVRPAGGLGCQASYPEDVSTLGSEDTTIVPPGGVSVSATTYSVSPDFRPPSPGAYQVCAWLSQNADGSAPLAAPATVSLTARGPQVSQLVVTAPKTLTPNVSFQISYLTQTDQQLNLLSVIAKAGPAPCAPAYEQQAHPVTTVFGNGKQQVFGGPITTTASVTEPTGAYVVCTWIEGPNGSEVDAARSTAIPVGTPSTPSPKPGLRLTRLTASRRHGITAGGTTTSKFTGRLLVTAACGRSTSKAAPTVKRGRFSAHLALPRGCRRAKQLKVTAAWGGSRAWAKQTVARTAAIKP